MAIPGPKTEAGKQAVAANLPHPVRHGLRSRLFALTGSIPCNLLGCPENFSTCEQRDERQPCPVLPEIEKDRLLAMVEDIDPAVLDPRTGEVLEPAGGHLSVMEIDAISEYCRLGTVILVASKHFERVGLFRLSESEGLAMQGAFKQWAYCLALRDRLRDRWGWKARKDDPPTNLAVAILAATLPPRAPVPVIEGVARVLPPPGDEAPRTAPHGGTSGAPEGDEPCE